MSENLIPDSKLKTSEQLCPKVGHHRFRAVFLFCIPAFLLSSALYALVLFLFLNACFPFSLPGKNRKDFAVIVVAGDGSPLRSFPDEKGVWRYPVRPENVSPLYLEALINYEDRYFYLHPGVNPLALMRAVLQYMQSGHLVSGGSTLTMQVARILQPHPKTVAGKCRQMFRALQLEYSLSKKEILGLYLNYAPFGGPVEGVQAAAYAYLGKSAGELSHAEAALLAVLPQSPTRMRPDRHPRRAEAGRNKILDRMAKFGIWNAETVASAKIEKVQRHFHARPLKAPLLARRLKEQASPDAPLRSFIDPLLQESVAGLIRGFIADTPEHSSAAVLIAENRSLAVKVYVGSADFLDNSRFGHVDMVQASRSPGSTLKPFLYAVAMEEGLIHSQSLMCDAPFSFSGYRPDNFTRHFTGPVSAAEALQRSLNLPSVDLLDRVGPKYFDARLRQGGLHPDYPPRQEPNLTLILGGAGTSLENLVSAYRSLAAGGLSGPLRFTENDPLRERRLLSPGAAYIILRILREKRRPDLPAGRLFLDNARQVAWKTGTSYGFRDAWTIGVTDRYTIGVWVGRPDGTPSPGQYGRATAAPLLFRIVDSLPRQYGPPLPVPDSVSREEICWPLGKAAKETDDDLCHERRQAWVLNGSVPPTLPDRSDRLWLGNPVTIRINPRTGLRVDADCPVAGSQKKVIARWPAATRPWLPPRIRRKSRIPSPDPACGSSVSSREENIRIMGIEPDTVFRPPGAETRLPSLTFQASGGREELYWLLNGDLIARVPAATPVVYSFRHPGQYQLTVMDPGGSFDSVKFRVIGGGEQEMCPGSGTDSL
ncbi:MAG: penicillin-binding protein 1C [Desulfococcaceae bacterium]|nr:penicillin-binding protein 1C [Desulfococcaceae bacterium]